jgi:RND family efflux transporter MFP subunit
MRVCFHFYVFIRIIRSLLVNRKKQIIFPVIILTIGIIAFIAFSSMKKPPPEKEKVDNTPIVMVKNIRVLPMTLNINSYGLVKPKYETSMVAQIKGEIVELSKTFVRGAFIKKGQLLAQIDPNDYQAALIDAEAKMASAKAALEKEIAQGKVAKREWTRITNTSPTKLSLRQPQLAQELARVKSAQAAILRAKRNLQRTEIRAPYDAMISHRAIGLGSFVGVGTPLGTLLGISIAEIRLPVSDEQLQFLTEQGKGADVQLLAHYAGKEHIWKARIVRNEGVIDQKSRMNYLVAEVNDPYRLQKKEAIPSQNIKSLKENIPLRFGVYVQAKILGITLKKASLIPNHLIVNEHVALLNKDFKLHYVKIKIIRQKGANVIVSEGLKDGEQLIISALNYPVNGMKLALREKNLTIKKTMISQNTTIKKRKDEQNSQNLNEGT